MKKLGKILLLLISLLPISAWILLMTVFGGYVAITTEEPLSFFILIAFISIPVQWIFYITNVFRNTTVAKNQRVLWVMMLLFGHVLTFPFYWYFHIWQDDEKPKVEQTPTPPTTPISVISRVKSKSAKVLLLVAGFLPVVFIVLAIYIAIFNAISNNPSISLVCTFSILYWILLMCLTIFYVMDVFSNQSVPSNQRAIWAVALKIGNLVVFPFYWYTYIWNKSQ